MPVSPLVMLPHYKWHGRGPPSHSSGPDQIGQTTGIWNESLYRAQPHEATLGADSNRSAALEPLRIASYIHVEGCLVDKYDVYDGSHALEHHWLVFRGSARHKSARPRSLYSMSDISTLMYCRTKVAV